MNKTSVAPTKIINKMYENHVNDVDTEEAAQTSRVCKISVSPRVNGCLRKMKRTDMVVVMVNRRGSSVISENSLY